VEKYVDNGARNRFREDRARESTRGPHEESTLPREVARRSQPAHACAGINLSHRSTADTRPAYGGHTLVWV